MMARELPGADGNGCTFGPAAISNERVNIIGTAVSAIDMERAIATIRGWIERGVREYVCVRDAHGLVRSVLDPRLRAVHNRAGLVTPDGMPLVWLCRRAGFRAAGRVYGPDLMPALCEALVERGCRHFFYGGAAGVADELAARLRRRVPGLVVAGTHSPPFGPPDAASDEQAARLINAAAPDVVWVGLGTPKQELWMARLRPVLAAPVLIGVGAAFDFHTGRIRQAPRWMQRSALEWLFRAAVEPVRLLPRYVVVVPAFLVLVGLQKSRLWRFPLDEGRG